MNTSMQQDELIEQIDQLREKAKKIEGEQSKLEDFQEFYRLLQKVYSTFRNKLEEVVQENRRKEGEREFRRFYWQVASRNASELVESLKRTGYRLQKKEPIQRAFEGQGYRLLELVRAGKREEVFHAILRIFVSINHPFPTQLVEAFKPVYSDDLFKVFLFSFLSGVMGKEETKQENP